MMNMKNTQKMINNEHDERGAHGENDNNDENEHMMKMKNITPNKRYDRNNDDEN